MATIPKETTFEGAMTRLEQIVSLLEAGKCSLDESLELFEEGTKLTYFCSTNLNSAEQKIRKLTAGDVEKLSESDIFNNNIPAEMPMEGESFDNME